MNLLSQNDLQEYRLYFSGLLSSFLVGCYVRSSKAARTEQRLVWRLQHLCWLSYSLLSKECFETIQNRAASSSIYNLGRDIQEDTFPCTDSSLGLLRSLQSTDGDNQAQKMDSFRGKHTTRCEQYQNIAHTLICGRLCNLNSTLFQIHKDSHRSTHFNKAAYQLELSKVFNKLLVKKRQ